MQQEFAKIASALICMAMGVGAASIGYFSLKKGEKSKSWPSAKGKIISSEITQGKKDIETGSTQYKAQILYEFYVNEVPIKGGNIKVIGPGASKNPATASRYTNKYRAGDEVNVYYDPDDPYESVLEPGVQNTTWIILGIGVFFLLLGIAPLFGISLT